MMKTRLCIVALVVLTATTVSCGSEDSGSSPGGSTPFAGTIRVLNNTFSPANVTVAPGDSVTWRFEGSNPHTVTEGATKNPPSPMFDSGTRSSGTFGFRFNNPGTVPYHCEIHFDMGMKGTITVSTP